VERAPPPFRSCHSRLVSDVILKTRLVSPTHTQTCSGTTNESLYDGSFSDLCDTTSFESGGSGTTVPPDIPSLGAWGLAGLMTVLLSASVWAVSRRAQAGV
jgi:hypothetical protein